jgi:hypothetical protein
MTEDESHTQHQNQMEQSSVKLRKGKDGDQDDNYEGAMEWYGQHQIETLGALVSTLKLMRHSLPSIELSLKKKKRQRVANILGDLLYVPLSF